MKKALRLLALCAPGVAPGTSIIAIKAAGSISISVDSKATLPGGASRNSCQIYRFGKLYFAIAGLVRTHGGYRCRKLQGVSLYSGVLTQHFALRLQDGL